MNKKNTLKKTAALAMGMALTLGAAGCDFVVTDSEKDLAQVIATVDITSKLDSTYAQDVGAILENLPSDITKRDLIAYFLSVGYQYVESYGYTYKDTFNMLLDGLISREIMIQYAVAEFLEQGVGNGITKENCEQYITAQLAAKTGREKELLEAHPEILTLKYFLTDGGTEDTEDYDRAVYTLKKSFNDSLDSMETSYIKAEEEDAVTTGETRTLPTNAGTEDEEYYTTDYDVYTGRNTLDKCGEYEKQKGSTTATRQKAYNSFLANLQSYSLVQSHGDDVEDTKDVTLLDYYYVELSSSLGQALITKYFETLEDSIISEIDEAYALKKYEELYNQQKSLYENKPSAFASALESASADSFLLYGLDDFGFVYNILLPFSTSQTEAYTNAQNRGLTQDEEYNVRKGLLSAVKGKDQRESWITKDEATNYSYQREGSDKYYFFKDNLTNTEKYAELTHYWGEIPYDGTVTEKDGEYEFKATERTVDDVINILKNAISEATGLTVSGSYLEATYAENDMTTKYTDEKNEVDYSKFVYYKGQVEGLQNADPADYFEKDSALYKMAAVTNELMFAYSTDTGCLNTYMGYSISPYGTNYMKEFEYAAQEAVKAGPGTIMVAPTDYGWHIIVSTFTYTKDGEVFGTNLDGYKHAEKDKEGSFSNLFYESLKASAASNYSNEKQSSVLNDYDNGSCVTRYEKRYKDLLEMDK